MVVDQLADLTVFDHTKRIFLIRSLDELRLRIQLSSSSARTYSCSDVSSAHSRVGPGRVRRARSSGQYKILLRYSNSIRRTNAGFLRKPTVLSPCRECGAKSVYFIFFVVERYFVCLLGHVCSCALLPFV